MMIKKIVIEMESGKFIELTNEEARQLYNELHGLFGIPTVPYYPTTPYPYPPFVPTITTDKIWIGDNTNSDVQFTTTSKVQ